jgi:hypothetical protein
MPEGHSQIIEQQGLVRRTFVDEQAGYDHAVKHHEPPIVKDANLKRQIRRSFPA